MLDLRMDSFQSEKKEEVADLKESDDRDDASTSDAQDQKTLFEFTNIASTIQEKSDKTGDQCKDDESASHSSVSFGSVRVREYERVIDSSNIYMGLSLGWNYNEKPPTSMPTNMMTQKSKNHAVKYTAGGEHGGEESRMKRTNGSDRYGMLLRYGYEQKELKQATKEAAKFYKQRQREAARALVLADERTKQAKEGKPKKRMLFRSMFG